MDVENMVRNGYIGNSEFKQGSKMSVLDRVVSAFNRMKWRAQSKRVRNQGLYMA